MATIMMARGRPETVLNLTTPGLAVNDYRIPQDIQGARFSFTNIVTGGTVNSVSLEGSTDGINYGPMNPAVTSAIFAGNETIVVPIEGVMAIRFRWVSTTGATATVVVARCA